MNTNVDALKTLYEQLGGDPADVANCSTSVEVLNAISSKYGGAADASINPDAINNIAAIASSIGGGSADFAALIDRSITSVVIPEGVTKIGSYAFAECFSLESVVIPEGVTTIGNNAFMTTDPQSIVIPRSVTRIGSTSFRGVSGTLYCKFSQGAVSGAPWGAVGQIVYDYNE